MSEATAEVVSSWLVVNIGALVVLVVLSVVGSILALDGLAAWDKWMMAAQEKRLQRKAAQAAATAPVPTTEQESSR